MSDDRVQSQKKSESKISAPANKQWIGAASAFGMLGLLIGLITGMTSDSVVSSLLSLLFAFLGGSIIVLLNRLNEKQLTIAYRAVFWLTSMCIVGLIVGIVTSERQLLSPSPTSATENRQTVSERKYLKSDLASKAIAIKSMKAQGGLTAEEAYSELQQLVESTLIRER